MSDCSARAPTAYIWWSTVPSTPSSWPANSPLYEALVRYAADVAVDLKSNRAADALLEAALGDD